MTIEWPTIQQASLGSYRVINHKMAAHHHVTGKYKMATGYHVTHNKMAVVNHMIKEHKMATGHHVMCNKMPADEHMMKDHVTMWPVTRWWQLGERPST